MPTKGLKYLHSFALTTSYAIVVLWPCHIDVLGLALGDPVLKSIIWDGSNSSSYGSGSGGSEETDSGLYDSQTRVIVVRLSDGALVANVTTDPYFAYHHVNAHETINSSTGSVSITLDTTAFKDTGTM